MKKLLDILGPDPELDPARCRRDPECHRRDGHPDQCKTVGVIIAEKIEARLRRLFGVKGAS